MTYFSETCTDLKTAAPARRRGMSLTALFGLWRQRRALRDLDDAALSDIGITRACAEKEAARPFWDVPSHWLD